MENVFDIKSPNGELYDDTIVTVAMTYYLRDGEIVDREAHEVYFNDDRLVAEALAVDCTTEPVKDPEWYKRKGA